MRKKRSSKIYLAFWGAALLFFCYQHTSFASSEKQAFRPITIEWVNERGKIIPINWRTRQSWGWARVYKNLPVKSPSLRTWIEIPKGIEIVDITSKNAVVRQRLKRNPFSNSKGTVIALDSNWPMTSLKINYKRNRKSYSANMFVRTRYPKTKFWTHPKCKKERILLRRNRSEGKNLYVAINCLPAPEGLRLFVISSPDSVWGSRMIGKEQKNRGKFWKEFLIPKVSKKDKRSKRTLGRISSKIKSEKKISSFTVVEYFHTKTKRFFWSAGLGVSYLKYTEQPFDINVTEMGLTGKLNVSYVLKPGKWDIGGNTFGTILPLTHSISPASISGVTLNPVRFYGINARVGYQLSSDNPSVVWKVLLGGYFWGMNVPGKAYGIKTLFGPQVFLTGAFIKKNGTSHYLYTKFAPISETLAVNLSNREVALGGGYQIGALNGRKPIHLTLDLAYLTVGESTAGNTLTLASASLGAQVSF